MHVIAHMVYILYRMVKPCLPEVPEEGGDYCARSYYTSRFCTRTEFRRMNGHPELEPSTAPSCVPGSRYVSPAAGCLLQYHRLSGDL
ncbi:hypothetical protein J4Q44_G00074990 [Coregonus suidteri]|uniref:Uncharacterized protein n=1 Tax=Coregonus suidteri TaxID=861788 RepID=A0AAN8MAQ2_9TELE